MIKKKCIPYVEISQKTETMPDQNVRKTFGSVILTDEYTNDQTAKSYKARKNSYPLEQQEFDSKLFLTPTENLKDINKPEW
jgi:uridine kinase